jgi:hypothetical protein
LFQEYFINTLHKGDNDDDDDDDDDDDNNNNNNNKPILFNSIFTRYLNWLMADYKDGTNMRRQQTHKIRIQIK